MHRSTLPRRRMPAEKMICGTTKPTSRLCSTSVVYVRSSPAAPQDHLLACTVVSPICFDFPLAASRLLSGGIIECQQFSQQIRLRLPSPPMNDVGEFMGMITAPWSSTTGQINIGAQLHQALVVGLNDLFGTCWTFRDIFVLWDCATVAQRCNGILAHDMYSSHF